MCVERESEQRIEIRRERGRKTRENKRKIRRNVVRNCARIEREKLTFCGSSRWRQGFAVVVLVSCEWKHQTNAAI